MELPPLLQLDLSKTLSKLKSVVVSRKAASLRCLKKNKPLFLPPPPPIPLHPPRLISSDCWSLPYKGGALIGTRYYTAHALARMAPSKDFQVLTQLKATAVRKAREAGVEVNCWDDALKWTKTKKGETFFVDPRGIPPSAVEAEIAHPGSTGVPIKVILNEQGNVITVRHLNRSEIKGR